MHSYAIVGRFLDSNFTYADYLKVFQNEASLANFLIEENYGTIDKLMAHVKQLGSLYLSQYERIIIFDSAFDSLDDLSLYNDFAKLMQLLVDEKLFNTDVLWFSQRKSLLKYFSEEKISNEGFNPFVYPGMKFCYSEMLEDDAEGSFSLEDLVGCFSGEIDSYLISAQKKRKVRKELEYEDLKLTIKQKKEQLKKAEANVLQAYLTEKDLLADYSKETPKNIDQQMLANRIETTKEIKKQAVLAQTISTEKIKERDFFKKANGRFRKQVGLMKARQKKLDASFLSKGTLLITAADMELCYAFLKNYNYLMQANEKSLAVLDFAFQAQSFQNIFASFAIIKDSLSTEKILFENKIRLPEDFDLVIKKESNDLDLLEIKTWQANYDYCLLFMPFDFIEKNFADLVFEIDNFLVLSDQVKNDFSKLQRKALQLTNYAQFIYLQDGQSEIVQHLDHTFCLDYFINPKTSSAYIIETNDKQKAMYEILAKIQN